MSKLSYFLLFLAGLACIHSCTREEDNFFSASASERLTAAIKEYNEVLIAAPNGWLMEYYAGKSSEKIGGYNYICAFDATGKVTVATEIAIGNHAIGDKVSSLYRIVPEQSAVLTFDTYNELLHYFSEPKGSTDTDGYQGDYEFVFQDVSPEKIVLKGKKYGNPLVMTPLAASLDWTAYLSDVAQLIIDSNADIFSLLVNSEKIGTGSLTDRLWTLNYKDSGKDTAVEENVIYTPTGFKFYTPVKLANKMEVQNFQWNDTDKAFECTDAGINVVLKGLYPDNHLPYSDYLGTYDFTYSTNGIPRTATATISPSVKNKSYIVSGLFDFDFRLDYSQAKGIVKICPQLIGTYNGNNVWACSWSVSAGQLSYKPEHPLNGHIVSDAPIKVEFVDSGTWSYPLSGITLYLFDSSGGMRGRYSGGTSSFQDIVMTKR